MPSVKNYKVAATAEEKSPIQNDLEISQTNIEISKYPKPDEPHWFFRRIYILSWIKSYDREKALADLIAGITLGLTIIPQSLAYAALARLSPEYGLYTAFVGSFIYVFFGTIPQVSIGPTSLMALMVRQYCENKPVEFVIILAFMAGLVELLMGVFKLGFVVSFISSPVNKAFTTGTAIIICLVQMATLLGVKSKNLNSVLDIFQQIKLGDACIGFSCLIVLLLLRQLSSLKIKRQTKSTQFLKKLLWYISISRNALVVFFCAVITYVWVQKHSFSELPYAATTAVKSAELKIQVPPFAFEYNNMTYVFSDIVTELGSGIVVVPIVAVLANIAIARAFVKDGQMDASQEMLTLGLCNLAGSLFSAMPTCGAFTRSAVSNASGVRTPMAGIYTSVIVLLALSILTPYFQYIPQPTLAAVLIAAVMFMIDLTPLRDYWRNNKKDFFMWLCCLIICVLVGVEKGLFFGILMNIIFICIRLGNPKLLVTLRELDNLTYLHIVPQSDVYYSGAEKLRQEIRAACMQYKYDFPLVLNCTRFMQFDITFMEMLNAVAKEMQAHELLIIMHRMPQKLQHFLSDHRNVHFCNGSLSAEDLMLKMPCA